MHDTTRRLTVGLAIFALTSATGRANEFSRPDDHAPISVMGDHFHEAGEFMFSYRYMQMDMQDNAIGRDHVSPETIATTVANPFFGRPMQPPTLRVVPTEMTMRMHMRGLMYAPSNRVTLMGMVNHVTKEMEHLTFAGGMGTSVLGTFTTQASGIGDTSLAALVSLHDEDDSRLHLTAGVSVPTGDTDATDDVLAPTGMRPTLRLPYPMQLSSGTYDLLTGLTYARFLSGRASFGVQWRGVLRTGDNDEGYTLGDEHRVTAWLGRTFTQRVSGSLRLEWFDRGNIDGADALIAAPVQTADPLNRAATRVDLGLGLNYVSAGGHRAALELVTPFEQDLDGPQLRTDWQLTLGYQLSF